MTDTHAPVANRRHPFLLPAILGCAGLFLLPLLGGTAWYALDRATRKDTPEQFAGLASVMCSGLLPLGVPIRNVSDAEALAFVDDRRALDQAIRRKGDALAAIAAEDQRQIDECLEIYNDHHGFAPLAGATALAAVGFLLSDSDAAREGSVNAVEEFNRLTFLGERFHRLRVRHRANQIALAKLAPRFSGPMSDTGWLTATFEEEGFLFFGPDNHTLRVTQSLGIDIHDCLVYLQIVDSEGNRTASVHFVPTWRDATTLAAVLGEATFNGPVPAQISQISIQAWARESSAPALFMVRPPTGW